MDNLREAKERRGLEDEYMGKKRRGESLKVQEMKK